MPAHDFKTTRRVEFVDTDMAGILHFSNYFRYMEAAEHAFFRSLGFRVHNGDGDGAWGWARRNASCTFDAPLHYEDEVELWVIVREKRRKSIRYEIVFSRDGACVARGELTAVCVALPEDGRPIEAVPMPSDVDAAIEVAPAGLGSPAGLN